MKKIRFLTSVLILALLLSSLVGCVSPDSYESFSKEHATTRVQNGTFDREQIPNVPSENGESQLPPIQSVPSVPDNSSFEVHFIDVGQADSALILSAGKSMLIDGGNVGDSNLVYSYLQKLGVSHLDYVVCTHAHEDHVGGLSGALSYATVGKVYSPVTEYSTRAFENFVKKVEARGKSLTVPTPGESFSLGDATVKILGPLKVYDETNDTSIVLRITYGELSFLFTGDMESSAEADLIDAGIDLRSTVLKVGHHGSSTSSSYRFLKEVAPRYGVISVGTDNDYGHPHEEVLSRYRDADVTIYRTDLQGDIVCKSEDGKTLLFTVKKNGDAVTNPTESEKTESDSSAVTEYAYIGNINSKTYHNESCASLPYEKNRIYFTTKEEATAAGYHPCGTCKP